MTSKLPAALKPHVAFPQFLVPFIPFTMSISLLSQFLFILLVSTTICIPSFTHAHSKCMGNEKTLLLGLKNELIFDSSGSRKLVQWNQTEDCCSWEGVECDAAGHAIGLQLDGEAISGGIDNSSSLFSLTYLEKLNLAENRFNYIQIPRGIGNLTYLTHLNLSCAEFGGQVPVELSLLTRLVSLDISKNLRSVPQEAYSSLKLEYPNLKMLLQNLGGLRELYLDGVDISAGGSEWCQVIPSSLPDLRILSLRYCSLLGPLDPSLLQLRFLSVLQLDYNNLSTTVPDFFANFSSLTTVTLRGCFLEGSLPEKIFQAPALQRIDLSYNELITGNLPQFPRNGAFRSIELSSCSFSGPIPTTLANLTQLVYLDLSRNFFTGSIPPFYMSKRLTYINLCFNSLNGSLSSMHFEGLSNLVAICLAYNSLSGSIPDSLFGLPSLRALSLRNNKFNGTFQLKKIQGLRNLTELELSYNSLSVDASSTNSSTFPKLYILTLASCNLHSFPDLRNQSNLGVLDLSNNGITGEVPNWIWEIGNGLWLNLSSNLLLDLQKPYRFPTSLEFLDLHSNLLQGELSLLIPPNGENITSSLRFFSLAKNNLSGSIPTSLCNGEGLEFLDLSANKLSGDLPSCVFANIVRLQVLNLARNKIGGDIPDGFPGYCTLETLDLSDNNLGGTIPKSLANCKSLVAMNVGNNNINDGFPCMLPSSLRLLVLRSNRFHGEVRCRRSWPNLQIIDVASNNLSGHLYQISFSRWRGMMHDRHAELMRKNLPFSINGNPSYYQDEVTLIIKGLQLKFEKIWGDFASVDLSCNNFQGTVPDAIGDLSSLDYLNLSHNALTGTIPKSFGKLRQLESLDLSVNQLAGTMPMELAGLSFLQVLNVSYNRLVGKIPNGRQLQTFSADSFEGNTGLCGLPLNISCSNDSSPPKQENVESYGKTEVEWGYVSAALGYVVGLGSFVWVLVCCPSLRWKYFEKVDEILDRIFDCGNTKRRHGRRRRRRALRNQVGSR